MRFRFRSFALIGVVAVTLAACGGGEDPGDAASTGDDAGDTESAADTETTDDTESADDAGSEDAAAIPEDGPTITVASFNFTESEILGEVYAQALQDAGYPVETQLNLGSREVIFPEFTDGSIDLLPEYVGGALSSGFGAEPTSDLEESLAELEDLFAEQGVRVLEPAPGEDKDVFVVTQQFSEENGVTAIPDLADVGDITLAGPPECESRDLCYLGLTEGPYTLDNLDFQGIAEGAVRISSLENGEVEVATLFSTQPVIRERGFVALDDPEGLTPVQNIVPVVSGEVFDAYGTEMAELVNSVTELITTDTLIDLNGRVELDAQDPAAVAADFLSENGITG